MLSILIASSFHSKIAPILLQDMGETEQAVLMEMNKAHESSAFLSSTQTRLKSLPTNPTEVFNIADGFVRRIIKVAKQLDYFRNIEKDDQIADYIRNIYQDKNGHMWMGTNGYGIVIMHGSARGVIGWRGLQASGADTVLAQLKFKRVARWVA